MTCSLEGKNDVYI